MPTALNESAWSTTPASNDGADSTIGTVANTSSPTNVDDWVRGVMAARAKARLDLGGALVAGGTSTALTVTTNQSLSSGQITNGLRLCVRTASAATGAATIALDGLSAVTILKNGGGAIAAGDWASGAILELVYSSTATAFIAANISGAAIASSAPSTRASFKVHKNGTHQTINTTTPTKLTWSTEAFDVGSYFASDKWTPPAGTAILTAAAVTRTDYTDSETFYVRIYKNGSFFAGAHGDGASNLVAGASVSVVDQCNGSDYYEVYVASAAETTWLIEGASQYTFFSGSMI